MLVFDHAICATVGARDYQEDTARAWAVAAEPAVGGGEPGRSATMVGVLADGMGGHVAGALASQIVCEQFHIALEGEPEAEAATDARLAGALEAANGAVAKLIGENPVLSGMGTTVVAAIFDQAGVQWISVGDSPAFLFRRGEVAQFNADHSLAPELDELAARGKLTAEEARNDPRRHMLRAAVTGDELDLVDLALKPLVLEPGDFVVLASDGVQSLEPAEMARLVSAYGGDGASAVARRLIAAVDALGLPYQDNATVVVVGVNAA